MGMVALVADMEVVLSPPPPPPPSSLSALLLLIPDDGSRRRFSFCRATFLLAPVMVDSAEDSNNSSGTRSSVRTIVARLAERADDEGPCLRDDDLCDGDIRGLLRLPARWSGTSPNMASVAAVVGGDMVGCAGAGRAGRAASDRPQSLCAAGTLTLHSQHVPLCLVSWL